MPEIGPEIPRVEEIAGEEEQHHQRHDRFARFIPIATVLTTLIAALVAFAQASALSLHDRADARAEEYGALALNAAAVNRGKAEVQIDRFNLLTRELRAADNASLFDQYGNSTPASKLEPVRWKAVAAQTETDTAAIAATDRIAYICAPSLQKHCSTTNAGYSPQQDPSFPNRFMQQTQWSSYRLTALRDGANQQADQAETHSVHYAAILTMLAVAVFLFGYSLTPQGRARRRLFSTVAGGFVLVAGVWALVQALSPVQTPPDAAAAAFANGKVELETGSPEAAIVSLTRAIKLRPEFVDAYAERAQAEYNAGIPRIGSGTNALPTTAGPVTVPDREALNKAVEDNLKAREAGSESATVLSDLGRDLFDRGLVTGSSADLLASHQDLEEAVAKLRSQDHASLLVAAAELRMAADDLALGREEADHEYAQAAATLRGRTSAAEPIVAVALTDLSLIATRHPRLVARADDTSQQLVAAADTGMPTPTGDQAKPGGAAVTMGGIEAQPDPGHSLYTISKPGAFDPAKDAVSVQWEYKDPLHGEWAVLPELSGPVRPGGMVGDSSGYASNNPSYVSASSPATCLPAGRYRVQIYVNGHLAGSAKATGSWPALHAVRFSDIDGAICVPAGWKPAGDVGAGTAGYAAPDFSSGVFLLSIPKRAASALAASQPDLASLMSLLPDNFKSILPGLTKEDKPSSTPFFMSSDNGQLQHWRYRKGVVLTGVGTSSNGQVYVGMTWGPDTDVTPALFLSLSPL